MAKVESKVPKKQHQSFVENLDTEVSLIQAFIPIGLRAVQDLLYQEIEHLASPRYHCKDKGDFPGYRWGSN